jgi:hypothetical protein
MAIYTRHRIELLAATDGTDYKRRIFDRTNTTDEVSRTDYDRSYATTMTIPKTTSITLTVSELKITKIRFIYLESDQPVNLSILDDDGDANEVNTLQLAGPSQAGSCKFFAEMNGLSIAATDTVVISVPGAVTDANVSLLICGDD